MMTARLVECHRRCLVFGCILACCFTFMASPAWAQEATIFGQVTDESGAVLPGVTVTVSSPALQVKQMVEITSVTGEYRVTPLPLGTYAVEYTLTGFQSQRREGIRLTAGFVAKVDVQLKVGSVEETVTVSGVSPVVDVKTTSGGTQVTHEMLQSVPTNRNSINSLMTLAAGTRGLPDNGAVNDEPAFRAFGRIGEPWILIEGVPTISSDANNPGAGNRVNYEAFEEGTVETFGGSAEAPTAGVQVSVIVKSGGNDFHGTGQWVQTPDAWQGNNVDTALQAQGVKDPTHYFARWDAVGDVGGRIVRDKVWFYASARRRIHDSYIFGGLNADGSRSQDRRSFKYFTGKGTAQLTPTQKVIGAYLYHHTYAYQGPAVFAAPETHIINYQQLDLGKAEWQLAKGNKFLSVQVGIQNAPGPRNVPETDIPAWTDSVTAPFGGLDSRCCRAMERGRNAVKATLNWYQPDLFRGNHDFKIGGEAFRHGRLNNEYYDAGAAGNYALKYKNAVPDQVVVYNTEVIPESSLNYFGLFFQDSWSLNRGLTFNLGVRYAHDSGNLPAQCRTDAPAPFTSLFPAQCFPEKSIKSWNPVAPRLHLAYDVTGDGKTVVKGGWGRFYLMHNQQDLDLVNPNTALQDTFKWHAPAGLQGNERFVVGQSNLDVNGTDFVSQTLRSNASLAGLVENPDLLETGSDEFSLQLERELMPNLAMRVTGLYSKDFNSRRVLNTKRPYDAYNIPVPNQDPGPDAKLGTADDPGTVISYYDYPASLAGIAFQVPTFINDAGSNASYKSIELAVTKRMANRWQLMAAYTGTKNHNLGLAYTPQGGGSFDPNSEINAVNNTYSWITRVAGSYLFPADIQVSANVLYQSGDPWARTIAAGGGKQITSITLKAEPIGTQRTPTQTLVFLRAEKAFHLSRLPAGHRLIVGASITNLFNANFITYNAAGVALVNMKSGPQLGYATEVANPRLGEFTIKYTF